MSKTNEEIKNVSKILHPFASYKKEYLSGNHQYKCLILGTFPSQESEKNGYFYGNKNNAFWEILGEILQIDLVGTDDKPITPGIKKEVLDKQGIALYDIVESYEGCDWYSDDNSLFNCGKNHEYSVDFVYDFLTKYPNAKIMVTSKKVEEKFKANFICKGKKQSERNEKHLFFEKVTIYYLPSPSRRNYQPKKEKKEEWLRAFKDAGLIQ